MAKERFLIIASRASDDCYSRFSESDNRAAIEAGTVDTSDPYSWIEASFEIRLVRWREATHLCSITPSAYYVWLQNVFVGQPNEAWQADGDPEGLECENGGEGHGYGTYRDDYDSRFICETFTIDTMRDLESPMRKPGNTRSDAGERYHAAIWKAAEEAAQEMGVAYAAPILETYTFRQWEREQRDRIRAQACERSRHLAPGML